MVGGLVPTSEPFLYTISATATDGPPLARLEEAALAELERVRLRGVTEAELQKAVRQLRARLVFENDSITNIAHQLGYFETIASWRICGMLRDRIDAVTLEQVAAAAFEHLRPLNRTVAWFEPLPVGAGGDVQAGDGAGAGPVAAAAR